MIVAIKGRLAYSTPILAVVETGGLFYEVNIPVTTAEKLPRGGGEVLLHTLAVYREDSQSLYGFATAAERDFFKTLVEKVSGIGPRIALNMMSRMSVEVLKAGIASGDVAMLSKCPGIGNKTAQRLVVELRDAMFPAGAPGGAGALSGAAVAAPGTGGAASNLSDAVAALAALGMKLPDADKAANAALAKIAAEGAEPTTELIVRRALSR